MSTDPMPKIKLGLFILGAFAGCEQDYNLAPQPVDVDPGDITECGFTPIAGTRFSRYDCNPVFKGAGDSRLGSTSFHAEEVLGHPFYQMWFTATPDDGSAAYTLNYAVSADGVNWDEHEDNPVLEMDKSEGWDIDAMDAPQVVYDPAEKEYVLIYQGVNFEAVDTRLGMYTSPDGVDWDKTDNSPLIDLGEPINGTKFCWPLAFTKESGGDFAGYVAGGPANAGDDNVCQAYRFEGTDIHDDQPFELDFEPVLPAGPEKYDRQGMTAAAVAEFEDNFYMFYVGFESWTEDGSWLYATFPTLSVATSEDGRDWEKDDENPQPIHASEEGRVSAVAAQVIGKRIHLWVTDYYEDEEASAVGYFYYEPDIDLHED